MIRTNKSRVVRKSPVAEKMERLRHLLGEKGYWVFRVSPKLRKTSLDIVAVEKDYPPVSYWLYPTKTGRVVVRAWRIRKGASQEFYSNIRLPDRERKALKLLRSSPMPETSSWHNWLTKDSKKEAEHLKVRM